MPRYTGWRRLSGNTADRPDLLDLGKRLLGELETQRRLSGVKTCALQRQAPDGSIVRASFIGDIPTIDVIAARPTSPAAPATPFHPQGFVVTPRSTAHPNGLDPSHPQQILQYQEETSDWRTFTYAVDPGAYGSYKARFPDGLWDAGNLDWLGAVPDGGTDADRVRLTYYGPMRRYWYDSWRKPRAQYGHWVFLNGQVLLDLEDVNAEREAAELPTFDETLVLGAAYRGGWLYVMQADIADFGTEASTIPNKSDFPAGSSGWISPPYPDGDSSLRLVRYPVVMQPQPTPLPAAFRVSPTHAETLWTRTSRGQVNPWVFAPDVSACETFCMPDELRAMKWEANSSGDAGFETTEVLLPSSSSEHIALSIAADGASAEATISTVSAELVLRFSIPAEAPLGLYAETVATIAADYTPEGERVELIYTDRLYNAPTSGARDHDYAYATLRIGAGPEVTVADAAYDGTNYTISRFQLALADLRSGLLVLDGLEGDFDVAGEALVRVYRDGVLLSEVESSVAASTVETNTAWNLWRNAASRAPGDGTIDVSPLYLLLGAAQGSRYTYTGGSTGDGVLTTLTAVRYGGSFPVAIPTGDRAGSFRGHLGSNNFFPYSFDMAASGDTPLSFAPADLRGYRTPAALATDGERVLLSLHRMGLASNVFTPEPSWWGASAIWRRSFTTTDPARFFSSHYSNDLSLTTLTGIESAGARFAPIWQFGAYPS